MQNPSFNMLLPFILFQCSEQGKLLADGKVIDSSLSRDPLVVVLGKRTVIPGKITTIQKDSFRQYIDHTKQEH